jgi:hypothetical protein
VQRARADPRDAAAVGTLWTPPPHWQPKTVRAGGYPRGLLRARGTPARGTYSECGFGSDSVRVSSACAEPLNRLHCQVVPLPPSRPPAHTHTHTQTHAPHSRSTLAHVRRRCGTRRIRACPLSTACAAPLRRSGSALAGCVCPSGRPAAALHPTDRPTLPTLRCLRPGGRPGRACP